MTIINKVPTKYIFIFVHQDLSHEKNVIKINIKVRKILLCSKEENELIWLKMVNKMVLMIVTSVNDLLVVLSLCAQMKILKILGFFLQMILETLN